MDQGTEATLPLANASGGIVRVGGPVDGNPVHGRTIVGRNYSRGAWRPIRAVAQGKIMMRASYRWRVTYWATFVATGGYLALWH